MAKKLKLSRFVCPICREPIAIKAQVCPHCRTSFSNADIQARVRRHRKSLLEMTAFVSVAAIVVGIWLFPPRQLGENLDENQSLPEVSATPDGYYFQKKDMYRSTPNDICRSLDSRFAETLVGRVSSHLPIGWRFLAFEDFNAQATLDGKGMQAAFRFMAAPPDRPESSFVAVGSFDPANCAIGAMGVGAGGDIDAAVAKPIFTIPGPIDK